tara:strand:- start:27712 stop:28083 length:372 start_codon:yes stop_codon:yes gene_type:complete
MSEESIIGINVKKENKDFNLQLNIVLPFKLVINLNTSSLNKEEAIKQLFDEENNDLYCDLYYKDILISNLYLSRSIFQILMNDGIQIVLRVNGDVQAFKKIEERNLLSFEILTKEKLLQQPPY